MTFFVSNVMLLFASAFSRCIIPLFPIQGTFQKHMFNRVFLLITHTTNIRSFYTHDEKFVMCIESVV